MTASRDRKLDPRTASVSYQYEDLGAGCVGRVYYWYDPALKLPAVRDWDLRPQYPEIDDETWEILFCEAFHRGETEFEEELFRDWPEDVPLDNQMFHLGRIFGPRVAGARIEQTIFVPPGPPVSKAEVVRLVAEDESE